VSGASDHFDGRRYFNPGDAAPRRRRDLLRWLLNGRRRRRPSVSGDPGMFPEPSPREPSPPELPPPRSAALTFIGHSTFLIRLSDLTLLTDPIFSERCSPLSWAGPRRLRPPGLSLDALPPPDVVLVSHNHYDHMDLPSLRALQHRFAPVFVTASGNGRRLAGAGISQVVELDWWQRVRLGRAAVTATPARHVSARSLFDRNRALWCGFMVTTGSQRLFFAGDSATGGHWRTIRERLGPPQLAMLPIGAYSPREIMAPVHMDPAEAVGAHLALGARQSIGMHFGTFPLTEEPPDAPLRELAASREAAGLEPDAFDTLGFGETRFFALG
jgi:L-ascorbate metabolism protein UlaG (beta-lactamase superfamily)